MTRLIVDQEELRPLVVEVVLQAIEQSRQLIESGHPRLAFREDNAAALIDMAPHQLRDRRLEGKVTATKLGRSWYYTHGRTSSSSHHNAI